MAARTCVQEVHAQHDESADKESTESSQGDHLPGPHLIIRDYRARGQNREVQTYGGPGAGSSTMLRQRHLDFLYRKLSSILKAARVKTC